MPIIVVVVFTLLFIGCSGQMGQRSGPASSARTVVKTRPPSQLNLSGVWMVSTGSGDQRTMTLVQNGNRLTGEVQGGNVVGEVKGDNVKVWLENDPTTVGNGTVSGNLIEGTFTCEFEGRSGSWQAVRSHSQGDEPNSGK